MEIDRKRIGKNKRNWEGRRNFYRPSMRRIIDFTTRARRVFVVQALERESFSLEDFSSCKKKRFLRHAFDLGTAVTLKLFNETMPLSRIPVIFLTKLQASAAVPIQGELEKYSRQT